MRRIEFVVQVTCDAEDTDNLDGIPSAVGAAASLFRLVLSEVCNETNIPAFKFEKYVETLDSYNNLHSDIEIISPKYANLPKHLDYLC